LDAQKEDRQELLATPTIALDRLTDLCRTNMHRPVRYRRGALVAIRPVGSATNSRRCRFSPVRASSRKGLAIGESRRRRSARGGPQTRFAVERVIDNLFQNAAASHAVDQLVRLAPTRFGERRRSSAGSTVARVFMSNDRSQGFAPIPAVSDDHGARGEGQALGGLPFARGFRRSDARTRTHADDTPEAVGCGHRSACDRSGRQPSPMKWTISRRLTRSRRGSRFARRSSGVLLAVGRSQVSSRVPLATRNNTRNPRKRQCHEPQDG